jgi:regulatory subunit for Cdc7p protein kinase
MESAANDSLRTLLDDEKLHGTRERDLSAPRPDFYYFRPGSKYLLIEDATGKHRPIMIKEYGNNLRSGTEYPVLFESFLRVPSGNQSTVPLDKIRERAWSLYVDRQPYLGEQPPAELRRSTSLRNITGTPQLPDALPYHHASGNSVVITSNIASTSNAHQSPAFINGAPPLGANKDRAILQMSKRVQLLKNNAATRLAAAKKTSSAGSHMPPPARRSLGGQMPQPKTFMSQEQVIKMLQQARAPVPKEDVSVPERIKNRDDVEAGLKIKEQDTASGYCENCRLRYSDLSTVSSILKLDEDFS